MTENEDIEPYQEYIYNLELFCVSIFEKHT